MKKVYTYSFYTLDRVFEVCFSRKKQKERYKRHIQKVLEKVNLQTFVYVQNAQNTIACCGAKETKGRNSRSR